MSDTELKLQTNPIPEPLTPISDDDRYLADIGDAKEFRGRQLTPTIPVNGDVYKYNATTGFFEPGQPVSTTTKIRVYMSGNTTINGDQQIPFDTVDYDTLSEWNTTSKQFTAKTAGYYLCYFQAYYSGVNFAFQYAWRIYKNSSTVIQEINIIPANANQNPITGSVTAFVLLAVGDIIDFHGYNQSGGAATVDHGTTLTYASIIRII